MTRLVRATKSAIDSNVGRVRRKPPPGITSTDSKARDEWRGVR
jgi:hypothetical protein